MPFFAFFGRKFGAARLFPTESTAFSSQLLASRLASLPASKKPIVNNNSTTSNMLTIATVTTISAVLISILTPSHEDRQSQNTITAYASLVPPAPPVGTRNASASQMSASPVDQLDPPLNVLKTPLEPCSFQPLTGFFRTGSCETGPMDSGRHTVCSVMADSFLAFSKAAGNDLSTPREAWGFPGLKDGDKWCLCALRWKEAYDQGKAPEVILEATHLKTLQIAGVTVETLKTV
ncbi:hypothetical protein HDU76_008685 [Blyttiomyces sp. JEL0837]|nr:hypothetical protein HDU76_008685 [Blyttiomyces sp. JEL0837]